jgi:hypothetical protein
VLDVARQIDQDHGGWLPGYGNVQEYPEARPFTKP